MPWSRTINVCFVPIFHSFLSLFISSLAPHASIDFAFLASPEIHREAYVINQPVFFGAAVQDHLCLPALFDRGFQQFAKGPVTRVEFAADHWVILSHAKEVNEKLEAWVEGL